MDQSDLREYYQDELRALRHDAAEFSRRYPQIAPMLGLDPGQNPDPMVERLIEAMAWFAARIRRDSEAHLPFAAQQILSLLYPNFASPIPAIGLARLEAADTLAASHPAGMPVPAGSLFHCLSADGRSPIHWRTGSPMLLHGASVAEALFVDAPPFPHSFPKTAKTYIRLRIRNLGEMDTLRLFLNGDSFSTYSLHDWVHFNCIDVAIADAETAPLLHLGRQALRAGGLDEDDLVFPTADFALPPYQLMQEYFTCPERFLFWDLGPLHPRTPGKDVYVYLGLRLAPPPTLQISPEMFCTNTVPLVNLFERLAEPIRVDHTRHKYRIIPDQRHKDSTEVHSVLEVEAVTPGGTTRTLRNYFSSMDNRHGESCEYWFARRLPALDEVGTATDLYFKDSSGEVGEPFIASARVLCTNRGKTSELGASTCLENDDALEIKGARLLRSPSPQRRPPMHGDEMWRLVSSICLHQQSLTGAGGLAALKETLRLYAPPGESRSHIQIEGLAHLVGEQSVAPLRPTRQLPLGGVAKGLDFSVGVHDEAFRGSSLYMFGSVLSRFLALYADFNSYSRLSLRRTSENSPLHTWPARNGWRDL